MTKVDKEWQSAAIEICQAGHWSYLIGLLSASSCIPQDIKRKQAASLRRGLKECEYLDRYNDNAKLCADAQQRMVGEASE